MALISWKQISPDLLQYGKLTGSLEVSGSIVTDGDLLPSDAAEFDIGSVSKPWRKLHGTASAASHSLTATTAATSSHLEIDGFTRSTISASFGSLNITNNITASAISCSGTIIADAFQFTGNDDTISFGIIDK